MRARIRTLKPEMWQDEKIGELSHGARLLFVGLITMADDQGRLRELPTLISGHVFPYDRVQPAKLGRWLKEVAGTGMVVRYGVGDGRYIAFRHWSRHQKVDKANDSTLPPPPEFDERSTNDRRMIDDESTNVLASRARASRVARRSDPDPSSVVVQNNGKAQGGWEAELALFDAWRAKCGHEQAKPTRERLAKIRQRRHEGYSDEQISEAIAGAARAPFVNDQGKRFDDIELICRNGSKLESFIERATARLPSLVSDLDRKRLASMNKLKAERGLA